MPVLNEVIAIKVKATVNFNFDKFNNRLRNISQKLTEEIKKDISQFVPYRSGELDRSAHIRNLGKKEKEIVWEAPYARHQYFGRVMRDARGRAWVGKGERKPYPTNPIVYSKDIHPKATAFWTREAKKQYLKKWAEKAKEYFNE